MQYVLIEVFSHISKSHVEYEQQAQFWESDVKNQSRIHWRDRLRTNLNETQFGSQVHNWTAPNSIVRGVCWDGTKSHRMRHVSREVICIWFWSGSKFELFIFLYFLARNIDHVSFGRSGSLFLARKCWSGSKFESFLHRIQFLFEFWETERFEFWANSKSNAYDFTWDMSHSMTFWPISPYPSYDAFKYQS